MKGRNREKGKRGRALRRRIGDYSRNERKKI